MEDADSVEAFAISCRSDSCVIRWMDGPMDKDVVVWKMHATTVGRLPSEPVVG